MNRCVMFTKCLGGVCRMELNGQPACRAVYCGPPAPFPLRPAHEILSAWWYRVAPLTKPSFKITGV